MTCSQCGSATAERVVRVRWSVILALYGAAILAGYFLTGPFLGDLAEGLQRSLLPIWKVALPVVLVAIGLVASFIRRRVPVCEECGAGLLFRPVSTSGADGESRRSFLRGLGAVGAGVAATAGGLGAAVGRNRGWLPVANDFFATDVEGKSLSPRSEWKGSKIKSYRRLGRTNVMVSDISLGGGQINDVEVARGALDAGINYFDTSPDYSDTSSEKVLGEAVKGRREEVFLATKFCVADGHLPNETPVPKIIEAVEASLGRLQTDHVDLIHVHSCDSVDRLLAPNIHEAFDRLKEQGKVRFLGVSTHTPNLEQVTNAAIDSGRFDVMMLAYHFGMWPNFGHILEKAKQKDVAVVAMKTLKGAKHTNLAQFREENGAYSQAAFRWVLSNPNVSCLVVSFKEHQHVEEYVYASGTAITSNDVAMLDRYDDLTRGDYCQPHCGRCLDSCEYSLPINDVLRYRMYFKDYGWEKEGMRHYAKLDRNASVCASCSAPCAGRCPIGVPIREKMMDADRVLRFRV
jgi:uncharacterized protein